MTDDTRKSCVVDVTAIVTDCPPRAVVIHFQSTFRTEMSISQADRRANCNGDVEIMMIYVQFIFVSLVKQTIGISGLAESRFQNL